MPNIYLVHIINNYSMDAYKQIIVATSSNHAKILARQVNGVFG